MKILITILSAIVLFFGSLIITEKQYQPVTQEIKESKKEKKVSKVRPRRTESNWL